MTTANIGLTAKEERCPNPPQPGERPKKRPLANARGNDGRPTGIPIRPMVWDGFVQHTGTADMDWAL